MTSVLEESKAFYDFRILPAMSRLSKTDTRVKLFLPLEPTAVEVKLPLLI